MNILDMRTIIFSSVISYTICAIVMVSIWLQNRKRYAGLGFWMADFGMLLIAFVLQALRGIAPDFFSMVISNSLMVGGAILIYMGLLRFFGIYRKQIINFILLGLFIFVHAYFVYIQPILVARTINLSVALFVICAQCAWLTLHDIDTKTWAGARELGFIFVGFCSISIFRIIMDLFTPSPEDYYNSGFIDTLIVLTYQMIFIILTFYLFMIVNRRLQTELIEDIAARKLTEQALRDSEAKFASAFHSSPYAITITRLSDGKFLEVNDGFLNLSEYQYSEAIGKTAMELNLWLDEQERSRAISSLLENNQVFGREFRFRRKSGELVPGLFSAGFITLNDEKCILSSISDITELKKTEESLRENQERLDLALRSAQMGVWDFNILNVREYIDEQGCHLLGINPTTYSGNLQEFYNVVHPSDQEKIRDSLALTIKQNVPYECEYRVIWPDTSIHYISSRGRLVNDENGNPVKVSGILWDTTNQKDMEETLIEAEKMIGIGTLAAGIAHEINTPLQIVSGISESFLNKLKEGKELSREELERRIGSINSNAWRIAAIVRSLIDYTLSPSEQIGVCEMNEIVEKTMALTEHQFKSWSDININMQLTENIPTVHCNQNKIIQVLVNLLNNARDAMPNGGSITICTGYDPEEQHVTIRVSDTGMGIPEEVRGRIFDPFFTTKPIGKGTGLGLSIASGILRAHHGKLELESSSEQGSVFKICLPFNTDLSEERDTNIIGRF